MTDMEERQIEKEGRKEGRKEERKEGNVKKNNPSGGLYKND